MKVDLFVKYILFFYLLAFSSFEFFFRASADAIYILFPVVTFGFFYYGKRLDSSVFLIVSPFVLIYILQTVLYGSPIYYSITLVIRLITVYFTIKIIGVDFFKIFVQTIKYISIISIILYVLQQNEIGYNLMISLSENFTNLNSNPEKLSRPNFIIYTIQTKEVDEFIFLRNSGPFWEPGLFSVFLNIALFCNLIFKVRIFDRTNILFIMSIITTFSTMGIIALLVNLSLFGLLNKAINFPMRVLIIFFLVVIIPVISSLSFMTNKIDSQMNETDLSYSRFGAIVVHYNIVRDYPLTGLPYDDSTYSKYADSISPNGVTEIFVRYGIIGGVFYYLLLFRAGNLMLKLFGHQKRGFTFFLIIIIVLFSETMGNKPIFWAIIFSQIPLSNLHDKWVKLLKTEQYKLSIP